MTEEVAEVIKENITRSLSKHASARTYHMEVNVTQSEYLENSNDATFPISWLQSVGFNFEITQCTAATFNWFNNHEYAILVNKHGQNLSSSDEKLANTLNWINPGK